jgi:hypothetical protein
LFDEWDCRLVEIFLVKIMWVETRSTGYPRRKVWQVPLVYGLRLPSRLGRSNFEGTSNGLPIPSSGVLTPYTLAPTNVVACFYRI